MSELVDRVKKAVREKVWWLGDCDIHLQDDDIDGIARAAIEATIPSILQIVSDQPLYPDTHTGMRQQWVKTEISRKIAVLGKKEEAS